MLQTYSQKFSRRDCQRMIELAEPHLEKAGLLGRQEEGYRTADVTWVPRDLVIAQKIQHNIATICHCDPRQMELVHIVKYGVGGQYKPHHDFFHLTEDYAPEHLANGGNRIKTALVYLNDNFEGGETHFPKLDVMVKPETGKLVIWENVNPDGSLNYDSIHAGLPVKSGIKYIAVVFIREGFFS